MMIRSLLLGLAVAAALGGQAVAQDAGDPAREAAAGPKYLSGIHLKRERMSVAMPLSDGSARPARLPRNVRTRPWPGPDVAYEVQSWSDGRAVVDGWCFVLLGSSGLGRWERCGR